LKNNKIEISSSYLLKFLGITAGILLLLFYGSGLLLPVLFGAFIAVLLQVPINFLIKKKFPEWLAMLVSVLLMIVIFTALFWFIFAQLSLVAEDWPEIQEKGSKKLVELSKWLKDDFGINYQNYIGDGQDFFTKIKDILLQTLSSFSTVLSQMFLTLVYIILFLMQKRMFVGFFMRLTTHEVGMSEILSASAAVIRSYVLGKGKIMLFLFGIYYAGFALGDVRYALFLALFAGLFSIIPYIGNFIGGGIAVIFSYIFAGTSSAIFVVAVIFVTQTIENYVLTPWIVGDDIDLNPFTTIFGVLLFSTLWGVAGAVISLPVLGVIKVILNHTKGLEAYAYIMKKK